LQVAADEEEASKRYATVFPLLFMLLLKFLSLWLFFSCVRSRKREKEEKKTYLMINSDLPYRAAFDELML
jgi:preprotein translocase subunit YajC